MAVWPLICRGHFASALIVAHHHRPGDHQPLFFSFIIKIKDKKRGIVSIIETKKEGVDIDRVPIQVTD
ncbi:hypothetical protein AB3S75_044968 [Citrus x aurantiifolia]